MHNFDENIERRGTDSLKWNTYPEDVIPMWVADSDFSAPAPIIEALAGRLKHSMFGYSQSGPLLDEATRHWVKSRFGWEAPAGSTVFSPGVVAALALAVKAYTKPAESVVTLSPSYPPLIRIPRQNGRVSLSSPMLLGRDGSYTIDFADLEEKLSRPETTLFLLCNPHNPTGRVFSREELRRIGRLCLEHGVLVFSDEIHCDYIHKGTHIPFPTLSPEFAENCVVALNPSKTFNIAGLHTAVVISENAERLRQFEFQAQASGLHPNILGAVAFHAAYTRCASYADEVNAYIRGNLELAVGFIRSNLASLRAAMPEATYLLWVDCRELGLGQAELMEFLLGRAKVAPGSGTDYNGSDGSEGEGFIRLNLACPRARLEEALGRIKKALE